jgi:hypothetical protein
LVTEGADAVSAAVSVVPEDRSVGTWVVAGWFWLADPLARAAETPAEWQGESTAGVREVAGGFAAPAAAAVEGVSCGEPAPDAGAAVEAAVACVVAVVTETVVVVAPAPVVVVLESVVVVVALWGSAGFAASEPLISAAGPADGVAAAPEDVDPELAASVVDGVLVVEIRVDELVPGDASGEVAASPVGLAAVGACSA